MHVLKNESRQRVTRASVSRDGVRDVHVGGVTDQYKPHTHLQEVTIVCLG